MSSAQRSAGGQCLAWDQSQSLFSLSAENAGRPPTQVKEATDMKKSLPKKPLTIPVIIDDVKEQSGFQMSRCTYFSLASNVPSTDITLDTKINSPSLMVGFVSVICRPSNRSLLFDNPRKISGLFERVEKNQGLYVDINDLWLPNFLFDNENRKRARLFRIGSELFKLAFKFQNEGISGEDFIKSCLSMKFTAVFSPKETEAFSQWGREQIDHARKYYKNNPAKWLKTPEKLRGEMR
jgi:hypothetical protein